MRRARFPALREEKLGLFELADGGTIFLDEVTELPAPLQSKLLRAIETRSFYRVGGVRKVQVDVRIVAATNRDLNKIIEDGTFRADLLYRVNGFQIALSPLRERPEDIEPLTRHLLRSLNAEDFTLTSDALDALKAYAFPGNVRQLRNSLERAVLLADDKRITRNDFPPEIARPSTATASYVSAILPVGNNNLRFLSTMRMRFLRPCAKSNVSKFSARLKRPTGIAARPPKSSEFPRPRFTAACVITTLSAARFNKSKVRRSKD
jgi:DNA-binding NtrC family response regulator